MTDERPRLLWLEDDDLCARGLIREIGHFVPEVAVQRVCTVSGALTVLSSDAPLLAFLCDVVLPDEDGLDALEKARTLRPDLLLAVLTVFFVERPEIEVRAFAVDAQILTKPVCSRVLADWLRRHLEPRDDARLAPFRRTVKALAKTVDLSEYEQEVLVWSAAGAETRQDVARRMCRADRPVKVDGIKDARTRIVAKVFTKYDVDGYEDVLHLVRRLSRAR